MAMTKAERAEMEALRKARDLARALSWPSYPRPAPMSEDEIALAMFTPVKAPYGRGTQNVAVGWYMNVYSGEITKGWSTRSGHNRNMLGGGSQKMGEMYRTYDEAARALRYDLTEKLAAELAKADALIARGEPPSTP